MVLDILIERLRYTHADALARYDLAHLRISEAFHNPQRDPVPNDTPLREFARDAALSALALYDASLYRPGSASYRASASSVDKIL